MMKKYMLLELTRIFDRSEQLGRHVAQERSTILVDAAPMCWSTSGQQVTAVLRTSGDRVSS